MSIPFQLTPRTLNDLNGILDYIADDSIGAANRVKSAILAACYSLACHPHDRLQTN
jgi:plasmid stabilization system protein ParE